MLFQQSDNLARAAYTSGWAKQRDKKPVDKPLSALGNNKGKPTLGQKLRMEGIPAPSNSQRERGILAPPARQIAGSISRLSGITLPMGAAMGEGIDLPAQNYSTPINTPVGPVQNPVTGGGADTGSILTNPAPVPTPIANLSPLANDTPTSGGFLGGMNPLLIVGAILLFLFRDKK